MPKSQSVLWCRSILGLRKCNWTSSSFSKTVRLLSKRFLPFEMNWWASQIYMYCAGFTECCHAGAMCIISEMGPGSNQMGPESNWIKCMKHSKSTPFLWFNTFSTKVTYFCLKEQLCECNGKKCRGYVQDGGKNKPLSNPNPGGKGGKPFFSATALQQHGRLIKNMVFF